MNSVKWIKITTDIFDDEKILLIETMPEHDSIIVIWFKLLALAGKSNNNGIFMLNDKIPYTDEMLASIFRRPLQTVRLALDVFEKFGMIVTLQNVITIPNWEKHQNKDGLDKIREQTRTRVQKYRMKQLSQVIGDKMCSYCGDVATGVDHIIPISKEGSNNDSNLVPCCTRCNRAKNDKELSSFLNNNDYIDKGLVMSNEKLSKFVSYDYQTSKFVTLQPLQVTQENKNKNKNKNKNNIYSSSSEERAEYPQEAKDLTMFLYQSCQEKDTSFKRTEKQLENWTSDFEKIHRIDGREWSQIEAVLKWARNNDFWRKNILSAGKFREKFERLYAGMIDDKPSQNYQQKPSVNLEGKIFF